MNGRRAHERRTPTSGRPAQRTRNPNTKKPCDPAWNRPRPTGHLSVLGWVVDSGSDTVYEYNRDTGGLIASFALAGGNTNPQGIADPPPALLPSENNSASAIALAETMASASGSTC